NRSFMLSQDEDGFAVLSDAVRLFENFFALKDGTVLTYGSRMLDRFESHTEKMIFYNITEFSGMIAHSVLMNLRYSAPVGPISENEKYVYDMEGFSGNTVFAFHTSKIVSVNPGWAGFARVKDEPRYIKLAQRIKQVSSLESTDNFLFLMDSLRKRTDEFVQDKKWACAVLVGDAGAYILFDDAEDIEKKFVRMEREGNTSVHQVATVAFGGDFIETPPAIRERLLKMCPTGESIKTVLRDKNGRPVFTTL
ncbi:MAG: hypothetical protein II719_07460, partial [Clostridia bacterium]|nr:hypothetical protein [Clostridia bacterium]